MITNISPVAYDPKADCPLWLQFLDEVMLGNQELIVFAACRWLQLDRQHRGSLRLHAPW